MAPDVTNAGAIWIYEKAVRDAPLVTSVYFGFLPEHMMEFLKPVGES